jgi:hypothetical protein
MAMVTEQRRLRMIGCIMVVPTAEPYKAEGSGEPLSIGPCAMTGRRRAGAATCKQTQERFQKVFQKETKNKSHRLTYYAQALMWTRQSLGRCSSGGPQYRAQRCQPADGVGRQDERKYNMRVICR